MGCWRIRQLEKQNKQLIELHKHMDYHLIFVRRLLNNFNSPHPKSLAGYLRKEDVKKKNERDFIWLSNHAFMLNTKDEDFERILQITRRLLILHNDCLFGNLIGW